jgi:hypothetical protein
VRVDERRGGTHPSRAPVRLKGKPPKLSAGQRAHLLKLLGAGEHTIPELADIKVRGRSRRNHFGH